MTITINPKFSVIQNGTMLKIFHANKFQGIEKHEHLCDHLTLCHSGSVVVRKEGRELVMTKDTQPVNLLANEWHEIEALEDGTVFVNVFAQGQY